MPVHPPVASFFVLRAPLLPFRTNTSLYRAAGQWRYFEHRLTEKISSYHLVSVECGDALDGN